MLQPDLIQDSIALAYNTPRIDPPLYPPSPPPTENSQSPISTLEYQAYYSGLPSYPSLIARSSAAHTPWVAPTDRFADAQRKELRPVGSKHKLNELWEAHLVQGFLELLDKENVDWTSVDVLRIVDEGQPTCSKPPIVWVGVVPDSLDPVRGFEVAVKCKEYLPQELDDVEVEFRESVVNFLGGSGEGVDLDVGKQEVDHEQDHVQFLPPPSEFEPTAELRRSLTATLGQSIAAQSTSWSDCTGGFYISVPTSASSENVEGEAGSSNTSRRIFLVTARHALLPLNIWGNATYDYDALSKSPPNPATNVEDKEEEKENILLLGDKTFTLYLARIQEKITAVVMDIELRRRELQELRGKEDRKARVENILEELEESLEKHTAYFQHVLKTYSRSSSRVLGHLSYSPSLHLSPSNPSQNPKSLDTQESHNQSHASFLLDYALIELSTPLTPENFRSFGGNAISLHSDLTPSDVSLMMDPALRRRYMKAASQRGPLARVLEREKQREREGRRFLYPPGGLLRVGGEVVGVREMMRPVRLEVPLDDDEHDEHKTDENKKNVQPNLLDEDDWGSASTSAPSRDQFHLEQERRRKQEARDAKDPDVMVLKRGHATGLTIGRANTIFSYIRHTERHMSLGSNSPPSTSPATAGGAGASAGGAAPTSTSTSTSTSSPPPPTKHKSVISKAWPILPYGSYPHTPQHHRQGITTPFAAHGDSGALVVDALGQGEPSSSPQGYSGGPSSRSPGNPPSSYSGSTARLGGILTAGCGGPDSRPTRFGNVRGVFGRCDVAYALPVEVVLADLGGRFGGVEVGAGG